MTTTMQGDTALLDDPVARELLGSRQLARLAYTWHDGTPRVVPIWFHWTGEAIALGSPPRAPKLSVLEDRPDVAVTIDDSSAWPYRALLIRGRASVEMFDDVTPEYALAATRYFGPEQGEAWVGTLRGRPMARITVRPTWVAVLDFETRFPSALSA
jgi:nitroimidazol reductase NimA-like FMN-containing flavoprotein (pyridoxamine 5'-phosphate oxidase superfamily)